MSQFLRVRLPTFDSDFHFNPEIRRPFYFTLHMIFCFDFMASLMTTYMKMADYMISLVVTNVSLSFPKRCLRWDVGFDCVCA